MKRRADVQPPIRLGGRDRQYAVPLPEDEHLAVGLPAPPAIITNLEEVLASAGLNADEITYLIANRIDQVPRCDLHRALPGWTTAKVERVRKALGVKLARGLEPASEVRYGGGDSLRLSFEEEVRPGLTVWTFATVTRSEAFREELARARGKSLAIIGLPKIEDSSYFIRRRKVARELTEVRSKLEAEKAKLSTIISQAERVDSDLRAANVDLARLREKAREEQENQILDETLSSDSGLVKAIRATEKVLEQVEAKTGAFRGAIAKQQQIISRLQDEITARKREGFVLALNGAGTRVRSLVEELSVATAEIVHVAATHGQDGQALAAELYPIDPSGSGDTLRTLCIGVVNAAYVLAVFRPEKRANA